MTLYKSKILDNILLKFKCNISVYWADLHGDKKIFSDIHQDYYIVENNINFLVGDGKLKRNNIDNNEYLTLTDTGFATMTDLENLGYVTKPRKDRRETRIKYIGFVLAIATFILLCFENCPTNNTSKANPNMGLAKLGLTGSFMFITVNYIYYFKDHLLLLKFPTSQAPKRCWLF
jgi:hypothetical protein